MPRLKSLEERTAVRDGELIDPTTGFVGSMASAGV